MTESRGQTAYRLGVGVAIVTSFATVWTTIVRDDGNGAGFFLVILGAGVGAFAAWFQAAGMARTMLGVAVMQALFGLAVGTAPITLRSPDGGVRVVLWCAAATVLWLIAAACFRVAARRSDF